MPETPRSVAFAPHLEESGRARDSSAFGLRTAKDTDPDLLDAAHDAITTMQGAADALSLRTATDPDPLLELLATALQSQSESLQAAFSNKS